MMQLKTERFHRILTYGKFSLEEVFRYINHDSASIEVDGKIYETKIDRSKLRLFKRSRVCAACGLVGQYFLLQQNVPGYQLTSHSRWGACYVEGCPFCPQYERSHEAHFNMYGERPGSKPILFTKDHIVPKSKGGAPR